jgi:integrase
MNGGTMNRNEQLMADWRAWLVAGQLSPASLRNRCSTLAMFARSHELDAVTTEDVQAWVTSRRSAYSMQGHLAALRSFYRWAVLSGRLDHDPTAIVRSVRAHPGAPTPVPEGILQRAILLAGDEDRLALLLGAYAGLRREEIATFHGGCIRGDHLVIRGKGARVRSIPIHPRLEADLDRLRGVRGWAFPSHVLPGRHVTPETIQRRVTRCLGEPWSTHDLRYRFATQVYRASLDIHATQALLGHSSPMTTARYVLADDDSMTAAVLAVA